MASIERRQRAGRRGAVSWRVRWRDADGRERSKTFDTQAEARRFKVRLEGDMAAGTWIDPAQARLPLGQFVIEWRKSIVDLRPTSLARIDGAVRNQILPEWGTTALSGIANADVRAWAAQLHAGGYSASTVRKAVFTLRRILAAAVADRRLAINAAAQVPLPVEEPEEQRYLTAEEVELLAERIAPRFRAMGTLCGMIAEAVLAAQAVLTRAGFVAAGTVEVDGQPEVRFVRDLTADGAGQPAAR